MPVYPRSITRLHAEEATLRTLSVDVKILRLEKRQVTLSVFRQLREESIFDLTDVTNFPTTALRGVPWGRVNYVWKGCPSWASYQLVWQDGKELKRMPLLEISELGDTWETLGYEGVLACHRCGAYLARNDFCSYCERDYELTYKPGYILSTYLFFNYIYGPRVIELMWRTWGNLRDKGARLASEVAEGIVRRLAEFEALDQLFIAV